MFTLTSRRKSGRREGHEEEFSVPISVVFNSPQRFYQEVVAQRRKRKLRKDRAEPQNGLGWKELQRPFLNEKVCRAWTEQFQ